MSTHLIAYRTAPQMERKAAAELRQAGIKACIPLDLSAGRRAPTARGYVFARAVYSNAFAKHVKGRPIGVVAKDELARLYLARTRRQSEVSVPFAVGQSVLKGEVPGVVVSISGRICRVETTMLGKTHTVSIHYSQLRPG